MAGLQKGGNMNKAKMATLEKNIRDLHSKLTALLNEKDVLVEQVFHDLITVRLLSIAAFSQNIDSDIWNKQRAQHGAQRAQHGAQLIKDMPMN